MFLDLLVITLLTFCCSGAVNGQCGSGCDPASIARYPTTAPGAGNVSFSSPEGSCITVGAQVTSSCDVNSLGASTFTCSATNNWNPTTIVCFSFEQCPEPDAPENGYINGMDYSVYSTIEYMCNEGFTAVGATSAQCTDTGTWSQPPPTCRAPCGRPQTNESVAIEPDQDSYNNGDIANFACPDLTMVGVSTSTCRDGDWEPSPPLCYERCVVPGITFASYSDAAISEGETVDHGSVVLFTCDIGRYTNFEGAPSTQGETVCNNGVWSLSPVTCFANCSFGNLTLPSNAYVTPVKPTYFHEEVIPLACSSGTPSNPNAEVECNDGRFFVPPMECIPFANCENPGFPANGQALGNDYAHGAVVEFRCNDNYTMTGNSNITCFNGSWSSELPRCRANCRNPGSPENGELIGDNFNHGAEVEFRCAGNYTLTGDASINCEDGAWSGNVPTCSNGDCENPGSPTNGEMLGNNFNNGADVEFRCNDNYTLTGNSRITCVEGEWNGQVPMCTANGAAPSNASARLECLSDSIRVTVDRSTLPNLGDDFLIFDGDRNCTGELIGNDLVFVTRFDQCGTIWEVEGDFDVYTNRITNGANGGAVISRQLTVSFPIRCYYERDRRIGNTYSVGGSAQLVQQSLVDSGEYDLQISMYADSNYSTRIMPGTGDIPVNERVYFAIELERSLDRRVVIQSCWTTPSNDPNDPVRYNLITERCDLEQTVQLADLGSQTRVGFSLAVFTFLNGNEIYMYCSVAVCMESDTDGECAACDGNRMRRGTSVHGHPARLQNLSVGPVRWVRQTTHDEGAEIDMAVKAADGDANVKNNARPWMIAVVAMATVIVVLVVTNLMTARNRRPSARFN
ncbi:CUB and sushi domain-containing protein 3-like [Diadema setosum]|uniref:CUB and sushi domain-containing protein 3-like n=1 Tax=Diadema setosum TaxID=31175 RepID=UPI003B3BC087